MIIAKKEGKKQIVKDPMVSELKREELAEC